MGTENELQENGKTNSEAQLSSLGGEQEDL